MWTALVKSIELAQLVSVLVLSLACYVTPPSLGLGFLIYEMVVLALPVLSYCGED